MRIRFALLDLSLLLRNILLGRLLDWMFVPIPR
jgi:hypothetical protein